MKTNVTALWSLAWCVFSIFIKSPINIKEMHITASDRPSELDIGCVESRMDTYLGNIAFYSVSALNVPDFTPIYKLLCFEWVCRQSLFRLQKNSYRYRDTPKWNKWMHFYATRRVQNHLINIVLLTVWPGILKSSADLESAFKESVQAHAYRQACTRAYTQFTVIRLKCVPDRAKVFFFFSRFLNFFIYIYSEWQRNFFQNAKCHLLFIVCMWYLSDRDFTKQGQFAR